MILKQAHKNVELRSASVVEFGSSAPLPWSQYSRFWSHAGVGVSVQSAAGLPAVLAAIRYVADNTAQLPLRVYRGRGITRTPADDSWQGALLAQPSLDGTAYSFVSDVAANIEGYGNSFIQKVKDRGRVVELLVLDPETVQMRLVNGIKTFDVIGNGVRARGLTSSDILHIRGFTLNGSCVGLSPVSLHRHSLGTALALEEFQGSYFKNDATPSGYLAVPGKVSEQDAKLSLQIWRETHGGLEHAGEPAILTNGVEWKALGVNLQDAQFVESQRFSVEQVARMYRIPVELLQSTTQRQAETPEQIAQKFLTFSLGPRLRMIESALAADTDLFAGTGLHTEFDTSALLNADVSSRYEAYFRARQAGWITLNEIRAKEGYPPVDGGDEVVLTPAGAGANQVPAPVSGARMLVLTDGSFQALHALEQHMNGDGLALAPVN